MNVAEQIVAQLVDAGVHRIYGIVGDSLNPIVDAVRKTGGSKKGGIDWIHVRHEEAAAFAASAEAQLTGKLAKLAGLRQTDAPVTAIELAADFSWDKVPRTDIPIPPDF